MQMVALLYIYVYCYITGVPPFDGRVRKRSRSNSNSDVEQQHAGDNMLVGGNAAGATSFVDVCGNHVVDKGHPVSKKAELIYFCIRIFAFYAMLCLRPLLVLALLMVYKAFKCAYVDVEITYTNLTYWPANEVNSFIYAFRQIFVGWRWFYRCNNNKDVGLESILLNYLRVHPNYNFVIGHKNFIFVQQE